jgi:hypothetical protein
MRSLCWMQEITIPSGTDEGGEWRFYPQYGARTFTLTMVSCVGTSIGGAILNNPAAS